MNQTPRNIPSGSTSHKFKEEITEYQDKKDKILQDVKQTAELIKKSTHCVIYTGAGVSTSAKIPDFRGPSGCWTLADEGKQAQGIPITQAFPTFCHYSIVELVNKKYVQHVISTNCDGLHRRSGLKEDQISELHGNCYKEICSKCEKEYLRGFDTTETVRDYRTHRTGRYCNDPFCKGELLDTTVAFGESLPRKELNRGVFHSKKADLTIVLGTSMRVSPACEMPLYNIGKEKSGNMILVNLQKTPYDHLSTVRSYAKTDEFMQLLMKELNLEDFNQNYDERKLLIKEQKLNIQESAKITFKETKISTDSRFMSTMSFCVDKNKKNCVVIIGGLGEGKDKYPGIEILRDDNIQSLPVGTDESLTYIYKPRWGHSASVIPIISDHEIYLIGGFDHEKMYRDVNIYDVHNHKLKPVKTTGDSMSFRAGHSSCVFQEKILLFGGQVFAGKGKYNFLNDFYSFDPKNNEWKYYTTKGDIPEPRSQHQAVIYKNMMIIVGGCDQNTLFNDIYALNLETLTWKKVNVENMPQKVKFQGENIFPAQFSCVILKNVLHIYGLCEQSSLISIDLTTSKLTKDRKNYEPHLSTCTPLNQEKAFMLCKKSSKWIGNFIKVE